VSLATLEALIEQAGLQQLDPDALEKFEVYLTLLMRWNTRLNLTAIREAEGIVRRHFIECIQCAQVLPPNTQTLLDFGSGAGFPGIPIAICRPEIQVTLGESQGKKASFLREAIRTLGLTNATVFDRRLETMPAEQKFTTVTLRAVDNMAEACKTAWPHVEPDGEIVIFATRGTEQRLKDTLPNISWQRAQSIFGLDEGYFLTGRLQK
jgi:16S rRNA (guanine527-N7)-methyltransferase